MVLEAQSLMELRIFLRPAAPILRAGSGPITASKCDGHESESPVASAIPLEAEGLQTGVALLQNR